MSKITQGAFNAGILSEGMYARSDTEKYQKGLRDAVNLLVLPQGGVANRAGFEAVTRFDTSGVSRQWLIPFEFNTTQTYQLEFTDDVFHVISDGAYVLDTAVGELPLAGVSAATVATLTMDNATDAAELTAGDLIYVTDTDGNHKLHDTVLRVTGVASEVISFVTYDGQTIDTVAVEWGSVGVTATVQKVYAKTHTLTNFDELRFAQDADTLYITHPSHPPSKIGRVDHDDWTFANVAFGCVIGQPAVASVSVTGATAADPVVLTAVAHGLAEGDAFSIAGVAGMVELNDELYIAGTVTADTIALKDKDGDDVDGTAYVAYTSGGTITSPGASSKRGTDVDLADLTTYKYAVAAINGDTEEEGVPTALFEVENDLYFQGSVNYLGWRATADATRYAVYRTSAGSLAYVGTTTGTTFTDENITPDTATGPQLARNPFGAVGEYPSVVSFYEQRLAYGATTNDPQLVEMSRVGNLENFNGAYPSLPDDAFRFRIRDSRVNEVRAFAPSSSFAILTSGGEWEIAGQGDGEYVRPDKRRLSPFSNYGSAKLPPLFTGVVVLFVEPSGNVVREYRPNDPATPPQDLTIIGADLLENRRIVSWAYAAAPGKIIWCVLDNGTLLTLTYMPEHDVWGWTRHQVGGTNALVRQVSVSREDARDVPYIVVTRTIDGREVTLVERQRAREDTVVQNAYFMDGGVKKTYTSPVSETAGLLHLRGETVTALLDGDVVENLTVDTTGTVTFGDREVSEASVGLSYESLLQTLDVRMDVKTLGSSEGRYKSTSEVAIKLKRSRGVEAGVSLARMNEIKEWNAGLVGGPLPLLTHTPNITVEGDWLIDATVFVRQRHPLPMTVLAVTPDWEMGE